MVSKHRSNRVGKTGAVFVLLSALLISLPVRGQSLPEALVPGVRVQPRTMVGGGAVRLVHDPSCNCLLFLTVDGRVFRLGPPETDGAPELLYTAEDHGLRSNVLGMDLGPDGTLYLVGNERLSDLTQGIIVRGLPPSEGNERVWQTVARTEPYPRSNTPFDHTFNGIVVSPDGASLYVNSGSRTDHGEIQDAEGQFPGLREVPLSSAIFRIPSDAQDLILPNDEIGLLQGGYLFADGVRNSFDLAFNAEGHLFATENSGDRDDSEELNWIREGLHYEFPWRLGGNDNPQQFTDYDPAADRLLNPQSFAVQNGFFHNDPEFPAPPAEVRLAFTGPLLNAGPDATLSRNPTDGSIQREDALTTFTTHRSPLGLVFDTRDTLPIGYTGDGFVLSWTGQESALLEPFADEGEDLLHLGFIRMENEYFLSATRIVRGFENPIDAVLVDTTIYVLEFGENARIWEVTFTTDTAIEGGPRPDDFSIEVFPHPVDDRAHVRLSAGRAQHVSVDVFSVTGRRVSTVCRGLVGGGGELNCDLEMDGLPSGVYFLKVTGETFSTTRSLVRMGIR